MNEDMDFDLLEDEKEVNVVLMENDVQIETDILSDEKSIDFNIVDDNKNVNINLTDDNTIIDFNVSDYNDTAIKEAIEELDNKKADKTQVEELSNQVEVNTIQIAQNKDDIEALDDRVDQIPIVTKTSQLTNDSGFITSDYHDNTKQDKLISGQNIKTINNESILGSGNISVEGVTNYEELDNLPSINNIELKGNKTLSDLGVQPAGDYALRSEIPDVSDFITKNVNDLVNYYKKSETFTKQEVNNLISAISTLTLEVVQTLPTQDISTTTIYLVPKTTAETNDVYDEYIYVSNAWEHIGSTQADLTNYYTKTEVDGKVNVTIDETTYTTVQSIINELIEQFGIGLEQKQNVIDNSNKLLSDYVNDTNQTNKFVTEQEKTTWNNKSDFSGSYNDLTNKPTLFSGDYDDLSDKPAFKYYTAEPDVNRDIQVTEVTKTIDNIRLLEEYGMLDFTPIDLSEYDTARQANQLHPYTQLPNGRYKVISRGRVWLGDESYTCQVGELIYKSTDEFTVLGYYVGVYYYWNSETEKYEGGFPTTEFDVRSIIEEYVISQVVNSGVFNVANKDNGYYLFNYSSASGTTRRININVEGTNQPYYPYNGTMLIKSDKYVVILGRENYIFEYDSTNQYYKTPVDLTNIPTALSQLTDDSTHRLVTDTDISNWNGKQDAISDLATIRSGASAGATALQPGDNISELVNDVDYATEQYVDDKFFYIPISTSNTTTVKWDEIYEAYSNSVNIIANIDYVENLTTIPVVVPLYSIIGSQSGGSIVFTFVIGTSTLTYIVTGTGSNVCTVIKQQNDFELKSNKTQDIITNNSSTTLYPSANAVYKDFQRKPVVIWESDDPTQYLKGIQADLSASPAWQLTDLDMTPYKRIKIYTCAGKGSTNISTTPAIVLEMSLDSRAVSTAWGNNYVGSVVIQKSNDANRLATLTCAVSADKTSFVVLKQTSLYGTAATTNNDIGANVFMIEGYYD